MVEKPAQCYILISTIGALNTTRDRHNQKCSKLSASSLALNILSLGGQIWHQCLLAHVTQRRKKTEEMDKSQPILTGIETIINDVDKH